MIPIGERCKECSKIHIIKSMAEYERLSPRIRTQGYRTEHRVFRDGYFLSLNVNDEIWEIYTALSTLKVERIQEEEPEDREQEKKEMEEILDSDEEED